MKDKTALIIGGFGGIGLATARLLSQEGITTLVTYHKKKKDIDKVDAYEMDVTNKKSVDSCIDSIIKRYKNIDIVVFSVSSEFAYRGINECSWEDFQKHIDVQLKGFFLVIQALKPLIDKKYPMHFIVLLTEACEGKPPAMMSHYITAKYGLMGFVKCMVSELSRNNCTFDMVSPGMVKTDLLKNVPEKILEMEAYKSPKGRLTKPEEVANEILFLISGKADDNNNGVPQ